MLGGAVIRRARRRARLTQAQLAERMSTTASAVSRWESGRTEPAYSVVDRAVEACGLTVASVLREEDLDPHDASLLQTTLAADVDTRLRRNIDYVDFVLAARRALASQR